MTMQNALEKVFERNAFYQRMHYLTLGVVGLCFALIILLICILAYVARNPPKPLYFATDQIGRLIQTIPVSQPNMKTADVMQWAMNAVTSAYSYDYVNYRAELQNAQKYFTNYGWSSYMRALNSSNNLLALKQRKMVIVAKVVGQPKILAQGILSGAYAWKFQMPVLITYQLPPYDAASQFSNPLLVTVIVQRQEVLQGYQGLGVLQMIGNMNLQASS